MGSYWTAGVNNAWTAGVNNALCMRNQPWKIITVDEWDSTVHNVPFTGCGCGFWAFWAQSPLYWETARWVTSQELENRFSQADFVPVCGVIEGWGRVLAGSLGFRCEQAKITALLIPPAYKDSVAQVQPQAMVYTNARAMYAEHPSGMVEVVAGVQLPGMS